MLLLLFFIQQDLVSYVVNGLIMDADRDFNSADPLSQRQLGKRKSCENALLEAYNNQHFSQVNKVCIHQNISKQVSKLRQDSKYWRYDMENK